jgi:hypothetical protein
MEQVYVIMYGTEVLGVINGSVTDAKEWMERRTGVKIEWDFSDSHGHVWVSGSYSIQETKRLKV